LQAPDFQYRNEGLYSACKRLARAKGLKPAACIDQDLHRMACGAFPVNMAKVGVSKRFS
jgi:hypothetical protein